MTQPTSESTNPELLSLVEVENAHIRRVYDACEGNMSHAARVLGIDRRTLYRRAADAGIDTSNRTNRVGERIRQLESELAEANAKLARKGQKRAAG